MADSDGSAALSLEAIVVRFGGLVAVDGLSLDARPGAITGLIGPNGAGKSTTFDVCSGFRTPSAGRVLLFGDEVTSASPQFRAQRGLGRTFQRMQLCDGASVRENVALGWEARAAGSSAVRQVFSSRREKAACAVAVDEALTSCGLEQLGATAAGDLSTGQRRLVELARVIAGGWSVLLLDEPSSGLDEAETHRFGEILQSLARAGRSILMVEHDMGLVMKVCEYLYVLDFGKPLFDGTPGEVSASDVVRAAYLGSKEAEVV